MIFVRLTNQCEFQIRRKPSDSDSEFDAYEPLWTDDGQPIKPNAMPRVRKFTAQDFSFLKVLGKGSFGKVCVKITYGD